MRKKRVMVIGPTRCGKTTLVNALNDYSGPLKRTQDMIYGEKTIDVPGSYIELPWMYKHLLSASQDASHVLVLVDQSSTRAVYSPGFAQAFRAPVIGIINKCDLAPENEEKCIKQLKSIGVPEPYYSISVPQGIGIEELKQFLFANNE